MKKVGQFCTQGEKVSKELQSKQIVSLTRSPGKGADVYSKLMLCPDIWRTFAYWLDLLQKRQKIKIEKKTPGI